MIEGGEVETLIVKDLSRLGREYLQVGQLTELYFPEKGVRFIAVNDGVDSPGGEQQRLQPHSQLGQRAPRQGYQQKVRAIKKMQAERGERSGSKASLRLQEEG